VVPEERVRGPRPRPRGVPIGCRDAQWASGGAGGAVTTALSGGGEELGHPWSLPSANGADPSTAQSRQAPGSGRFPSQFLPNLSQSVPVPS